MIDSFETAPIEPLPKRSLAWAFLVALLLSLGGHLLFGDIGLNLADEGFLWYGVERTLEGELALRDFQSYEPGRYWWVAGWCTLFDSGIADVRFAVMLFGAVGLFFGLRVVQRLRSGPFATLLGGLVLWTWMFPRHKVFETAISMTAVWFAVRLLERPSARRHLAAGLFVGFSGVMGRNHILYCSLGFFLVVLFSGLRYGGGGFKRGFPSWVGGVLLGFSPLWGLFAFDEGFRQAFIDSVLFFSKDHGSNLPLPYPWPWNLGHERFKEAERFALGASFLLPVVVYAVGLITAFATNRETLGRRRVLIAACCVGIFYAHHASVRSDANHLAQSIHPALIAALAMPAAFQGRRVAGTFAAIFLFVVSAVAVPAVNAPLSGMRFFGGRPRWVEFDARGDTLRLSRVEEGYLRKLLEACRRVPPEEDLFLVPGLATLYPLLERRSPDWGIYFLWPASDERQEQIAEALRERPVRFVLAIETPVDGNMDLLFSRTHPIVWEELRKSYVQLATAELPLNHLLLRRK